MAKVKTPTVMPLTLPAGHPDLKLERYTAAQAAIYLDVPIWTVYDAIKARSIGHRRLAKGNGGRVRFSQNDLDRWREAHRVEPDGAAIEASSPKSDARPRRTRVNELIKLLPAAKDRAFA